MYIELDFKRSKSTVQGPFFSLFLIRERFSSAQKRFLGLYFPQIRGMFGYRSGLRFSFWALEVPEPRVRKRSFSHTKMTSSLLSKRRKSKTISDYKHTLISEKLFWKFKPFGTVTCPWGFDVFGFLVNKYNKDIQDNQDNQD